MELIIYLSNSASLIIPIVLANNTLFQT